HERVRKLALIADAAARLVRQGGTAGELRRAIDALLRALEEHDRHEEAVLLPELRNGEPMGTPRGERMIDLHVGERLVIRESLEAGEFTVAEFFPEILDDLVAHMAAEERSFLEIAAPPPPR